MKTQAKKIINLFTICAFSVLLIFGGFLMSSSSKTVFGIGEVTSISASYDEIIITSGSLEIEKLHITAKDANEDAEELDATQDVDYYYVNADETTRAINGNNFNNYNFGAPGKYKFLVKLKANTEITTEFWVTVANKFTISFDNNGGQGEMEDVEFVVTGSYTLPQCEFTAPEGKMFSGWAIGSLDGARKYALDQISVPSNLTIYAVWKDIPHRTEYSIEFLPNGGTGEMATLENVMSEEVLPQCAFRAPEGKVFDCYKIEGDNQKFSVGQTIPVNHNLRILALWRDDCVCIDFDFSADVKQIAGQILEAKQNNKELRIGVGDYSVEFDVDAVQSFSDTSNAVILFEVSEENLQTKVKGAQKVLNISLDGTSFSDGEAKVVVPLVTDIPKGKVAKVYYINENGKAELVKTIEENGKVVFTTTHFSTFVLAYQDESKPLSGGMITLIVILSVLVVGISGFAIYWFGIKKNTFRDLKYIFKKR